MENLSKQFVFFFIGALALISSTYAGALADDPASWSAICTRTVSLNEKGQIETATFFDTFLNGGKIDVKPTISPEYDAFTKGHYAVMPAIYDSECNFPALGSDIEKLLISTWEKPIRAEELRDPRFVHLLPGIDREEWDCLTDQTSCGDVWLDGFSNQEKACLEGLTYVKCQLDCMAKIYQHPISYAVGACP